MGRGTRHSKNAGGYGSEALTYHEKRALGYGTVKERLGKDSVGNYDDCQLSLTTAKDPVATPEGVIYDREAILHCLVQQKKDIKRKMAAWEAAEQSERDKEAEREWVDSQARLLQFERTQAAGLSDRSAREIADAVRAEAAADRSVAASVVAIREKEDLRRDVRSFWHVDAHDGAAVRARPDKPDTETRCPVTGKRLRLKDLVDVRWTRVTDAGPGGPRHMDPVTKDAFTNRSHLVLLRATGDVMHRETYKKFVQPTGEFNGRRVRASDVVELRRGGTGYAAHDEQLEAKRATQMGINSASWQNDSKWGLKFR